MGDEATALTAVVKAMVVRGLHADACLSYHFLVLKPEAASSNLSIFLYLSHKKKLYLSESEGRVGGERLPRMASS